MLAKRKLRQMILGLGLAFFVGMGVTASAVPYSVMSTGRGARSISALWSWLVKTVELVLPWGETESEGGYIDPDGRP